MQYGRELLEGTAAELRRVAESLDGSFTQAVTLIGGLPAANRVVVAGIGKAGFIGMKLSATFASVGIPSFFLHPAEAAHGDLGRLAKNDIVLLLSNSGETPEILTLLPHVKRSGCSIIAITSQPGSTLAARSDVVLFLGEVREAGPLGLAPTTSTSLMLALGDALVMTVLRNRGFTSEQFAQLHPGGALGIRLSLVSEVMRRGEYHCIVPEQTVTSEVIKAITATKGRPGAASVVDSSGTLVGVFTDGNLRRCVTEGSEFLCRPVLHYMGRDPKRVAPQDLVQDALRIMQEFQIDQVVVVDTQNRPVGMVDIQDVFKVK